MLLVDDNYPVYLTVLPTFNLWFNDVKVNRYFLHDSQRPPDELINEHSLCLIVEALSSIYHFLCYCILKTHLRHFFQFQIVCYPFI